MFGDVLLDAGSGTGSSCRTARSSTRATAAWCSSIARTARWSARDRGGAKTADGYVVLRGLAKGERVVTSANFLLDSESSLKAALAAMTAPAPAGGKR